MEPNEQQEKITYFNNASDRFSGSLEKEWVCQKCGEKNSQTGRYCRKCGSGSDFSSAEHNFSGAQYVVQSNKGGGFWKWILIIFLVLVLAGGLVAGWYFWNANKQKKEARVYLANESKAFGNTVNLINDLSTEKELIHKNSESGELFLKKLEEEKNKTEKTLEEIKITRGKNNQAVAGEMTAGEDAMLKQYYQEAEETVSAYNSYVVFEYKKTELEISIQKEFEKIESIFKVANDLKSVIQGMKEIQKTMQSYIAQCKSITAPAGLEESNNKDIATLEKSTEALGIVINGMEKLSMSEVQKGKYAMDEALSEKNMEEINQLEEYYLDGMHGRFSELRGKADNIKTEFIKSSASLKSPMTDINIEGW